MPSPQTTPPRPRFARRHLSLAIHLLLAGAVAGTWSGQASAQERTAQDQAMRHYAIAPGPLADALTRFLGESGLLLAGSTELARGKTSPGLQGSFSAAEGLSALLRGTGLQALRQGNGSYVLHPVPEASAPADYSLREVRVSARRLGETEGTGSYTSDAITVGKTAQAMREMPQSVSVITRQRLEDQSITDLGRAADQTVGLTVQDNNYRLPAIYSRGFQIESIQLDGGAPMFTGHYANVSYDLAEYDRVELLRGAAGLLNGTGNPGGAINLVRKMPTATPQFSFTASAGSWDNYRTEFDASGPLAFDGKLRGRAVLAYEKRKYFIDRRSSEKPFFYGVLEADIGPDAVLAIGAREQHIHERGTNGWLPRYSNGADLGLPRSTGLTQDWSYLDGTSRELFAKLTWRLADRWTLRVNATQARQQGRSEAAFGYGAVDPVTKQGVTWLGTPQQYWNRQNLVDVNLSGAFQMLGGTHEVLVGADAQDIRSRWLGSTYALHPVGQPLDVFNPGATPWQQPLANDWVRDYDPNAQKQYGAYGTLRLELAEHTKLVVGARVNRFKYNQIYSQRVDASGNFDPTAAWSKAAGTSYSEPTKLTSFAGLIHDISPEWSAYASYAQIFRPQADYKMGPAPGSGLKPMRGFNVELGLKGELLDGRLNTAFALYRIVQDGKAVRDPRYDFQTILYAGSCCYLPSGKVVSQGIDLEINGEPVRGVHLYAGYTYNSNRDKTANAAFSTITPKHSIKLWGTWQLPGTASDWKLGAGATLQSRQYVKGTAASLNTATGVYDGPSVPFDYAQSGYAVWNAMAEYRIDPKWTLQMNLNNLLDKTYYRTVGSSVSGNYYGEPRSVVFTLRGKF